MADPAPTLVWFRRDLRLADHPALADAARRGEAVAALYVFEDAPSAGRPLGAAARWWLHHALARLGEALTRSGVPLILRRGDAGAIVPDVARAIGAAAVAWNRPTEPWAEAADAGVADALRGMGIALRPFDAGWLAAPHTLRTRGGAPFRMFTPFWRALQRAPIRAPLPKPERLRGIERAPAGARLADWGLLPSGPDWAAGFAPHWTPGEAGAHARLDAFFEHDLAHYGARRDIPAAQGTARLSPHLAAGEVSPAQVWLAVQARAAAGAVAPAAAEALLRELAWGEFCRHLLLQSPDLANAAIKPAFDRFPWRDDPAGLRAWQRGETGYPIVDAAMRALWRTGWMHNRLRMVTASFLVKHLLIDWREGERWFRDTLVDADPANNPANWQWVAGSGADAQPYFRIFNPVAQGEKFDPDGAFVRRWVPEVAGLPARLVHRPWEAPEDARAAAGLKLGETYPKPIVDHAAARARALEAFATLRAGT